MKNSWNKKGYTQGYLTKSLELVDSPKWSEIENVTIKMSEYRILLEALKQAKTLFEDFHNPLIDGEQLEDRVTYLERKWDNEFSNAFEP